jgi:hypothetical protein
MYLMLVSSHLIPRQTKSQQSCASSYRRTSQRHNPQPLADALLEEADRKTWSSIAPSASTFNYLSPVEFKNLWTDAITEAAA